MERPGVTAPAHFSAYADAGWRPIVSYLGLRGKVTCRISSRVSVSPEQPKVHSSGDESADWKDGTKNSEGQTSVLPLLGGSRHQEEDCGQFSHESIQQIVNGGIYNANARVRCTHESYLQKDSRL